MRERHSQHGFLRAPVRGRFGRRLPGARLPSSSFTFVSSVSMAARGSAACVSLSVSPFSFLGMFVLRCGAFLTY